MEKINFEAGTIVTPAKVNEDKTITPAVWEGKTPLSPFMLNKLQENIENDQIEQNTVIDELKAKTIKCLQEVETPTPVSGTSIDLSDSAEAKITELKISGNSKQETRSGKNKIEITKTTTTVNGCTHTIKDGTDTLSGTSTAWANLIIYSFTGDGKTYTLSGSPTSSKNIFISAHDNTQNKDLAISKNGSTGTFIAPSGNSIDIIICVGSNITLENELFKPQLELGSTATELEQGGASPSPDYLSEVESCGDNINLFDKNDITNNTSIDVRNGNSYTDNNSFSTNFIKINGITELCCNGLSDTSKLWGAIYDENKSYIKGINTTNGIFNETNLSGATYIRLGLLKTYLDTMKLEKGKVATPYSPYGQGCINEVICNKNICNFGSIQNSNIGLTNNLDKNVWKISGTSNENGYTTAFGRTSLGKFKAGTYSFSWKYSGTLTYASGGDTSISLLNKSLSKIIMEKALNTENKYSKFILTEDTEIALGFWNIGSGNVYSLEIECQLELSETNTEIVEHQSQTYTIPTQQPIRSIEIAKNTFLRDTFIKKNNKWYERHPVIRKIFDGSENWTWFNTGDSGLTGSTTASISLDNMISGNFLNGYCSHFVVGTSKLINTLRLGANNNTIYFYLKDTQFDNISIWTAWLKEQYEAGTPVYVDYVLAKPLDIECTEEQSTILFDIEQNAKTYDKITHMYSTDKVSPNVEVTYKKDIETLFANTLVEGV